MSFSFARTTPCPPHDSDVVIPLVRPPLWRRTLTWTGTVTLALVVSSAADIVPKWMAHEPIEPESLIWAGLIALWLALLGADQLRRRWVRRWPMPAIVFREHTMAVPTHSEARAPVWLRYTDVVALGESGRLAVGFGASRPTPRLVRRFFLETHQRVIAIDERWFADARGPDAFFSALRERLNAQPGGGEQLLTTERMRRPAIAAMARYPVACQMVIGIMAVFFLNTWLKGALQTPFGLLRWGAMAPALAYRASESYRFLSANFLHGHWLHVLMNVWALSFLGNLIERLLGKARFVIIFVGSALAAMLASAWSAGALLSVGASGAIFGLLGAFAVISRRLRRSLPLGLRQPPRWWLSLLAINTVLPLLWPVIDWSAHVAGFAVGVVLALALLGRRTTLPSATGRFVSGVAIGLSCLCVGALSVAVARAAAANVAQETKLAEVLLHDRHTTASSLNNLAWLWAIDRDADEEHLEAGTRCAEEAIGREPQVADFRVTLASLWERRGDWARARATWVLATEITLAQAQRDDDGEAKLFATARAWQVARSYLALAPASRPAFGGAKKDASHWRLSLPADTQAGAPLLLYVAAFDGRGDAQGHDRPVAIARLVVPVDTVDVSLPAPLGQSLDDAGATHALVVHVQAANASLPTAQMTTACEHTDEAVGWTVWRSSRLLPSLTP